MLSVKGQKKKRRVFGRNRVTHNGADYGIEMVKTGLVVWKFRARNGLRKKVIPFDVLIDMQEGDKILSVNDAVYNRVK